MNRPAKMGLLVFAAMVSAVSGTAQAPAVPLRMITLGDCLAAARLDSPDLKMASTTFDIAQATLALAKAANRLNLGESAQYLHQGVIVGPNTLPATLSQAASGATFTGETFQGNLSLTGPSTSLGLTAQHTIGEWTSVGQVSSLTLSGSQTIWDGYLGGRAAGVYQQAEIANKASQETYQAARNGAIYQVTRAYYSLLQDQDFVLVRRAIVDQASDNLALYEELFTALKATRPDVVQVQVALTQTQLEVRTAENAVATDRKKLSLAVGWALETVYDVADSAPSDTPALGTEEALRTAFQNRSELLVLEHDIDAAVIALSLQRSKGLPVVSIKGSLGVVQDWTAGNTQGAFSAGMSFAMPPILDGGVQIAQVKLAEDQIKLFKMQKAQQEKSITIEVENSLFGVTDTRDRSTQAVQNLQQAQEQYDRERVKLAAGLGTPLDELTAFSELVDARVGLAQAESSHRLAVLFLNSVLGL